MDGKTSVPFLPIVSHSSMLDPHCIKVGFGLDRLAGMVRRRWMYNVGGNSAVRQPGRLFERHCVDGIMTSVVKPSVWRGHEPDNSRWCVYSS